MADVICSKKNRHPFEWLRLSIRKKSSSVWIDNSYQFEKNGHPFELLMLSVWKKLEWFERLMSTDPEKFYFIVFGCSNSCCASVHSHKTIINQLFNQPTVSDGIQVFKWLGLSVQMELYSANWTAVFIQNKHSTAPVLMVMFVYSKIIAQEKNYIQQMP